MLDALDACDDTNDVRLFLRLLGDTQDTAGLGFRVLMATSLTASTCIAKFYGPMPPPYRVLFWLS
jgi:hypothetical protein